MNTCKECGRRVLSEYVTRIPNKVIREDEVTKVLFEGKNIGRFALIDTADYTRVSNLRWYMDTRGYVCGVSRGQSIRMHQLVMGIKPNLVIDHINGVKWDNRRSNLRHTTQSKNVMSALRKRGGVYFHSRRKARPWEARIKINRKTIHLGRFSTKEEAEKVRKAAVRDYLGETFYIKTESPFGLSSTTS